MSCLRVCRRILVWPPWSSCRSPLFLEIQSGESTQMDLKEPKRMCMARSMKRTRITACPLFMTMMCPVLFVLFVTDPLSECFQVKRPLTNLNFKKLYYDQSPTSLFLWIKPDQNPQMILVKCPLQNRWETSTQITKKHLPILTRNKTVLIGVIYKYIFIM